MTSSLSKDDKENAKKTAAPYSIQWIHMFSITIPEDDWNDLQDVNNVNVSPKNRTLRLTYIEYFIHHLQHQNVSCVLKSKGARSSAKGKFTIRLACTQHGCDRKYQFVQEQNTTFNVKRNDVDVHHVTKKARQVRGPQRAIARQALSRMMPSDYRVLSEVSLNKQLYKDGNLQHVVSDTTISKIREEALQEQDFDKDDIMDLLKWKLHEKRQHITSKGETDIYCRRISLDPFSVSAYSNEQFECVNLLAQSGGIHIFFDGTGSLVRHSGKKVFYYAGVLPSKIDRNDMKEKARLLTTVEFISGEHDSFNIGLHLREYKHEYHKKFPQKKWPIKHLTGDFSFAILNAVSVEWNNMKLIIYINTVYKLVNDEISLDDVESSGIVTFIQLCCGHLSKTHANDVNKHYPTMDASNQAILKEVFAGMCDMSSLDDLREVWKLLSTLLLSKYVNNDVESALEKLAEMIIDSKQRRKTAEDASTAADNSTDSDSDNGSHPDNQVEKLPDDTHEYKTMYEQSSFYQSFKAITFQGEFDTTSGSTNSFYSVEYADVFLKKYISVICFWTCLTQERRSANSNVECHFKNTKTRASHREPHIGSVPLKAGRFWREMKNYSVSTTNAILLQLPRNRCCKRKIAKSRATQTKLDGTQSVMSLYKSYPKSSLIGSNEDIQSTSQSADDISNEFDENMSTNETPKGRKIKKRKRNLAAEFDAMSHEIDEIEIDTMDEIMKIDDPNVEEQWAKRRKIKHSYMNKDNLREINKSSNKEQLLNILSKKTSSKNRKSSLSKLKNSLVDNPDHYLKPEENFVVACMGKKLLYKDEYASLDGEQPLNENLVNFVFNIFEHENNKIQFVTENIDTIINETGPKNKIPNLKKQIFIASTVKDKNFILIIVNINTKQFSYIDPCKTDESTTYFNNFLKFLDIHNKKFKKNQLPTAGWQNFPMIHQVKPDVDSGVSLLSFVKQYIMYKKIDSEFDPSKHRKELKHLILRKSTRMTSKCVKCGGQINSDSVKCIVCKRFMHKQCVHNKKNMYACIICDLSQNLDSTDNDTKHDNNEQN